MAGASHFLLLVWKNYLLQKRKVLVTVLEILLPCIFSLILIFIRQRVDQQNVPTPTTWSEFNADDFPNTLRPSTDIEADNSSPWRLFYFPNSSDEVNAIMTDTQKKLSRHIGSEFCLKN